MDEKVTNYCFYCLCPLSKNNTEKDHFPVPEEFGGKQVVSTCISCHDAKDRFTLDKFSEEWIQDIIKDFPKFSRSTKLFLSKLFKMACVNNQSLQ